VFYLIYYTSEESLRARENGDAVKVVGKGCEWQGVAVDEV
jgi:hypothetical protein